MLNANAKKWVEALRSGNYKQGKFRLANAGTYCCLGVACEVAKESGLVMNDYAENRATLPTSVQNWLGLTGCDGGYFTDDNVCGCLINDNDTSDKSFAEIAAIIESEPEGLFQKSAYGSVIDKAVEQVKLAEKRSQQ